MEIQSSDRILVTGGTGLVGSYVLEKMTENGWNTWALVRAGSDVTHLEKLGVELVHGDLSDEESLKHAVDGVTVIVHCAAKVGDWGPVEDYRKINVEGLRNFLKATEATGTLKRFVHVSSLGVYPARDHHGTDESEPVNTVGIDGYTLTKVESELLVREHIKEHQLPATILRPGFIYGPRDRTVLPRIFEKLKTKQFAFLGDGEGLVNNTYVGNLTDAIFLAIEKDKCVGDFFNITDDRLVSKKEFITTIAELGDYPKPTKHVPLPIAKFLAKVMEGTWKLLKKKEAPLLSNARIKFLGLNLDYSIAKAKRELGYDPQVDYRDGMQHTMSWFREHGKL